jgi:hypothetical protein
MDSRAHVVYESWQSQRFRTHPSTHFSGSLDNENSETFLRQTDRCG